MRASGWVTFGIVGFAAGLGAVLAAQPAGEVVVAQYATTLVGRTPNQRHNARLALSKLNGAEIAPGAEFSFNQRVGTWSRDTGYRRAPVSYNGTLIDAWGGGVCQTSTTLYNAALLAGLEVNERHPHHFAPSYCPPGRDAAVAFSGIDLRVRNIHGSKLRIRGRIEGERLVVSLVADRALTGADVQSRVEQTDLPREFILDRGGDQRRIRNQGKAGWNVMTFRVWADRRELVSHDFYPAMHRIVEYR